MERVGTKPKSRVFIVEDRDDMRATLADLLTATGAFEPVASAKTEAEASLWLEEHPAQWDLAIIDLVLEQGSGFGVIQRARAVHPQGRIVVMSGYLSENLKGHCVSLGADAVFEKGTWGPIELWLKNLR
jgi:DNA-binding NarL/FixJ family response regulator